MRRELVYRISPINGGIVLTTPGRAFLVDRINRAISSASTWSEFRKLMPIKEYSSIVRNFDDHGQRRPKGTDPFTAEQLPGYCDGDYPPWLQAEMDLILPISFLEKHGKRESTSLNGSFWMISREALETVLNALFYSGYDVSEASDLEFH